MMSALSASVVAAIDDLELAARLVVEGLRAGSHRSPYHGYSADFQQHRPYRAGDDLKYLDWKILARTDRLYTRQFRETTNMSVMIVIDTSASMAYPADGISKFRYATICAAALAYLITTAGDAVGLMTSAGGRLAYLPARSGRAHLRSLIARIDALRPAGSWDAPHVIARGAELLRRRGVVIVISDLYDAEDETQATLRRIARRGHDVALLQVTSPAEQALPGGGTVELQDLETGARRIVETGAAAAEYRAAVSAFLDGWRTAAHRNGFDYALLSTADPPERALRAYLLRRATPHEGGNPGSRAGT